MPIYTAFEDKTNVITDDLLALDAAAGEDGAVMEFAIGGEVTTSTAARVRLSRSSGGTTPVAADVQQRHPNSAAPRIQAVDAWTAQPVLNAGALFGTGWNAHGGVIRWLAAPGEEMEVVGAEQLSLRDVLAAVNLSGTLIWLEH